RCTSAGDVEPEPGAGSRADRGRCGTAAVGCTGVCPREHRKATGMRSSTVVTRLRPSQSGACSRNSCAKPERPAGSYERRRVRAAEAETEGQDRGRAHEALACPQARGAVTPGARNAAKAEA